MVADLEAFYRGRRVLVTGHTGFKGGWLCLWLKSLGAEVAGFALAPEHGPLGLYTAARVGEGLDSTFGDVRDLPALEKAFARARPDVVFHLAAQALVRRSYRDPAGTFEVNVQGTAHVLEAARRTGFARTIVVVTSDKCYQNLDGRPRREEDPLGGVDPYSSSKAAAEIIAASYRDSFFRPERGFGLATARAGNVIGGGDWAEDRLLPDCARAWREGRPARLRHPHAVRPWQHVLEPIRAYLTLAARLSQDPAAFAEAWNFGPCADDSPAAEEVARLFQEAWGVKKELLRVEPEAAAPYESPALRLDCGKAAARLALFPVWDAARAVREAAAWYRAQAQDKAFDARRVCLSQIETYNKDAAARAAVRTP